MIKIMLSGGGTLGPVIPLLAIAEIYRRHDPQVEFVWVGTRRGPEKQIVAQYHISFFAITSGKLRRYSSLLNVFDFFKIIGAFFESLVLLWQEKPHLLISAGGFVSVPLHWAAFFLGIPTWVHQQDFQVGLANKMMAKTARKITTALRDTTAYFSARKTEWIGNPVRDLTVNNLGWCRQKLGIPDNVPVVFAFGGGTGSARLNELIVGALPHIPKQYHIIHLTGETRPNRLQQEASEVFRNYHTYTFFGEEMKDAYAVADVIVARAGFATITELAALSKAAILLPMADTHQELNTRMLAEQRAAIILNEQTDSGIKLAYIVKDLVEYPEIRQYLGKRLHTILPPAEPEKISEIINGLFKE